VTCPAVPTNSQSSSKASWDASSLSSKSSSRGQLLTPRQGMVRVRSGSWSRAQRGVSEWSARVSPGPTDYETQPCRKSRSRSASIGRDSRRTLEYCQYAVKTPPPGHYKSQMAWKQSSSCRSGPSAVQSTRRLARSSPCEPSWSPGPTDYDTTLKHGAKSASFGQSTRLAAQWPSDIGDTDLTRFIGIPRKLVSDDGINSVPD
jgi:hypothetical protein